MKWPILILLLALSKISPAQDKELVFESASQRTHVLELFTSQGCSSCPPAEAWLSKLKSELRLWKDFVPMAFHVDYWDRLGWRDPFARKEWTARQSAYAENWKGDSVYTPEFVLDGKELRERSLPTASKETPGVLKLMVSRASVAAEFRPNESKTDEGVLHVALLLFNQSSKVTAGENNGRTLKQDFVVLDELRSPLSHGKAVMPLPNDATFGAFAAWVTSANGLEPIQATGGWVPKEFSDRLRP